ncbi:PqqD family protein [Bailinhaonella thermotolerans]|uniref:PqqD family protein n=1 Tax=Bailinhaonella thermotolerans TaxID=1070861 RepID=UPI00192A6578|nr:PqqD family protein [Bailinhaonella thermotolerans]
MTTIRLHSDVLHVGNAEHQVLLSKRTGTFYAPNPTAAPLVNRLAAGTTVAELARDLDERHAIGLPRATADVTELVTRLEAQHLIVREDG